MRGLLRETHRRPLSDPWISLSVADPLNLIGFDARPEIAGVDVQSSDLS
jgi:hypothetical protein